MTDGTYRLQIAVSNGPEFGREFIPAYIYSSLRIDRSQDDINDCLKIGSIQLDSLRKMPGKML